MQQIKKEKNRETFVALKKIFLNMFRRLEIICYNTCLLSFLLPALCWNC